VTHGTRYAYQIKECRCKECRAWNRDRTREQREKKKNPPAK
jgi:hypothetical protein